MIQILDIIASNFTVLNAKLNLFESCKTSLVETNGV